MDTKKCSQCQEVKPLDAFHKRANRSDGRQDYCKDCRKEIDRGQYLKNQEKRRAQNQAWRNAQYEALYRYLLDNPCVDCGEADPVVLEFDHVRGKKVANITELVARSKSIVLEEELAKCEVRCANCHRRITAERAGSWRLKYRGVV